jgi:hypothetical protein
MCNTMSRHLYFCLTVIASFTSLRASDRVAVRATTSTWSPDRPSGPDAVFEAARNELLVGGFDPLAHNLLDASEKFTKIVFHVPSLERRRAITYRNAEGDNLLAEWSIHESFFTGSIVLRDTPYYSTYVMQLGSDYWLTRNGLADLLTALIAWDALPAKLPGLEVSVPPDYPTTAEFVGSPPALFTSVGFIRDFHVSGKGGGGNLYIQFNVGKSFTNGVYPVHSFVPERFPPLTDLVQSWDQKKLLEEVGKPPANPRIGDNLAQARDLILITELARRGMGETDLVNLLASASPKSLADRAAVVFQALDNTGRHSDFDRYFQSMLGAYERLGPPANQAVTEAFRVLARHRTCAPDFEAAALGLLRKNIFQGGAMNYLSECSSSEESLHTVDAAPLPAELSRQRELTLMQIRRRLAQPRE